MDRATELTCCNKKKKKVSVSFGLMSPTTCDKLRPLTDTSAVSELEFGNYIFDLCILMPNFRKYALNGFLFDTFPISPAVLVLVSTISISVAVLPFCSVATRNHVKLNLL